MVVVLVACAIILVNALHSQSWRAKTEAYVNALSRGRTAERASDIPRIIWAYWNGPLPHIVHACMDTWRRYNPKYTIVILNKTNLERYLPDLNLSQLPLMQDSDARFADCVRFNILKRYGGIWMDASIFCNTDLSWLHALQKKHRAEFVGYYNASFTSKKWHTKSPVIESWFLACVPGSRFMADWCDEFMRINTFSSVDAYLADVKRHGTDFQDIGDAVNYLACHVAAQVVMQNASEPYAIHVICAETSAFKYLADHDECTRDISPGYHAGTDCNWNVMKGLADLFKGSYDDQPLIKLRGYERWLITQNYEKDLDAFFKHSRNILKSLPTSSTVAQDTSIPCRIWSFWDGDMPYLVHLCLDSWRRYNPDYDIIVLSRASIARYLPNADVLSLRHASDTPARLSDILRLQLLSQYGGIWMDASTLCNASIDFLCSKASAEYVGYRATQHMPPDRGVVVDVLETGVMACRPGCAFVTAWRDEFMRIHQYRDVADYVDAFKKQGIVYYGPIHPYWAVYVAQVWTLAKDPALAKKLSLQDATQTIYSYQFRTDVMHDHAQQVRALFTHAFDEQPLLKITHEERDVLNKMFPDVEPMFIKK